MQKEKKIVTKSQKTKQLIYLNWDQNKPPDGSHFFSRVLIKKKKKKCSSSEGREWKGNV